jgi:hypothetical protein
MIGRNSSRPNIWIARVSVPGEALALADHLAHLLDRGLLHRRRHRAEDEHGGVARVHRGRRPSCRDEHALVVAREVVAHLHLAAHGADDREAHAVDADRLAHGRPPLEELLAQLRAEERHAPSLDEVLRLSQRPSFGRSLRISP